MIDTDRAAGQLADMKAVAAARLAEPVPYSFTERERLALEPFFSNTDRKVFYIHGLPTAVTAALIAMYSRLKNPRGLRGHFVDALVPLLMLENADEDESDSNAEYRVYQREFKQHHLTTLDAVCRFSGAWDLRFRAFLDDAADPKFWVRIAKSGRVRDFLSMWLDKYGHKSIARVGTAVGCVEECSVLTAKSLEWARPGAGYIELSTRYVDFSSRALYPAWNEVAIVDSLVADQLQDSAQEGIRLYQELMGERVDGPFPAFLRERYGKAFEGSKDLDAAVLGEACDVLGNLLPCATLTSVGFAVSGEAFPQVLKHLVLDGTPENLALADMLVAEASRAGLSSFTRHWEPTPWERETWVTLRQFGHDNSLMPKCEDAARTILAAMDRLPGIHPVFASTLFDDIMPAERGEFDKLPRAFEAVSAFFERHMSFRSWRDLHRQGFCMHQRALVTPELGFYQYPKPAPVELLAAFSSLHGVNGGLFRLARDRKVLAVLVQYGMAMGNIIRYNIAANLRQWEFCTWQRTKWAVNDEARDAFLSFEYALRSSYPWWRRISRADLTPHYAFARGVKLPL